VRLFLYGTLAEAQTLARCGGRPLRATPLPARLAGFERVQLRGTRYPTLRRAPRATVEGMLARVTAETMRRLVAYESGRYRRIRVRVGTARGMAAASCFYGDAPTRVGWRAAQHHVTLRSRSF
jgi:gamma-glutamylcyclotransferase (GGCT)/AIG2-like uncharacterized protein YtfP